MLLTVLRALWQGKHKNGSLDYRASAGYYAITYAAGGKVYHYRASSNFALAERLDLIPEFDVQAEAVAVVQFLMDNPSDSIVTDSAVGDTARHLWQNHFGLTVDSQGAGTDKYGRPLARYFLADNSIWTSTL